MTLEYHSPKWDWYGNGGIEYVGRNSSSTPRVPRSDTAHCSSTTRVAVIETVPGTAFSTGFSPGSLSNCNGDTKDIVEGTGGFWYKPYNGPKGRLQFGLQYSYLTRKRGRGIGTKRPVPAGANPAPSTT